MDRLMLYRVLYALAACDGREEVLFGTCAPRAEEAFARSLAGSGFPELWFELPLAGKPWFDLHALTARGDLDAHASLNPATCGGAPDVFRWFAAQGQAVRQLALSWDVSTGSLASPAVQLLRSGHDTQVVCDFLTAAGRSDAADAYRTFESRLPRGWFACYTGVFPQRRDPFLRVECIPSANQQRSYASDPVLLEEHLRQTGLTELGDTLIPRCQALAATPFQFEFQFDVTPEGAAGATLGASVRFAAPSGDGAWAAFDANGDAGTLMNEVMSWGLADERWRLLPGTAFAKRMTLADESAVLWCYPAFLKLRWRAGVPLDAKAYLIAGVRDGSTR